MPTQGLRAGCIRPPLCGLILGGSSDKKKAVTWSVMARKFSKCSLEVQFQLELDGTGRAQGVYA
jgi:hypothetical protein